MSFTNAFETELLALLFQADAIANVADNAASSPLTNLYVSLHTASPGETGSQTTNESAYTSYARVAVARTAGGWSVSGDTASPASTISFPACTGGSETLTHAGIGSASSGAGNLYVYGAISPNIAVSSGVTPQLTTASTITLN